MNRVVPHEAQVVMRNRSSAGAASSPQLGQVVLTMAETVPRNLLKDAMTMPQVTQGWKEPRGDFFITCPLGIAP